MVHWGECRRTGGVRSLQENHDSWAVVNSISANQLHAHLCTSGQSFRDADRRQGRFEFAIPQEPAILPRDPDGTSAAGMESYSGPLRSFTNSPTILMARKPGFLEREHHAQTWQPSPVVPGRDVMIALVPEARILGRVVLPSSNASDRITVHLYRRQIVEGRGHWTLAGSIEARLSGEFRFSDLEAGTYKLLTGELMDRDPLMFDPRGPMYGYPPSTSRMPRTSNCRSDPIDCRSDFPS